MVGIFDGVDGIGTQSHHVAGNGGFLTDLDQIVPFALVDVADFFALKLRDAGDDGVVVDCALKPWRYPAIKHGEFR